jgi:hypothetical protein
MVGDGLGVEVAVASAVGEEVGLSEAIETLLLICWQAESANPAKLIHVCLIKLRRDIPMR